MTISKIPKYDYIDSLRGLAILGVIIAHTSQRVNPRGGFSSLLMAQGDKGVQLFFLVSALTLCFSLNFRKEQESHFYLNYTNSFFCQLYFWPC